MTKDEIGDMIAALPQGLEPDELIYRLVNWAVDREREACAKVCRSEADRALWNFQNDLPENNAFWNGAEQMASSCENLIKTRVSA